MLYLNFIRLDYDHIVHCFQIKKLKKNYVKFECKL